MHRIIKGNGIADFISKESLQHNETHEYIPQHQTNHKRNKNKQPKESGIHSKQYHKHTRLPNKKKLTSTMDKIKKKKKGKLGVCLTGILTNHTRQKQHVHSKT